ncbi:hypothetical protein KP509_02G039900 [Ceratopteris richardii]|uniref:Rhodanese domain-containing protein n=1 Tax=Ceratopteris richardii TaxID=49495 RepID=A0A8T2VC27_CERRI|nr:hypothetical protein KP509_02G039900 [Ceratopteris richardii]
MHVSPLGFLVVPCYNLNTEGVLNVPYMLKADIGLMKNLKFLEEVSHKFGSDDNVVVGFQMGKRSKMVIEELVNVGYRGITHLAGGYVAWVKSGMSVKSNA